MKHLFVASVLVASALFTSACGTEVDLGSRPQYRYGSNNLTLYVFDAQTGALLSNAKVTVVIADETLTGSASANAYVVPGIPNGSFPVTIEVDGFLPVTGVQTFNGGADVTSATAQQSYLTYTVAMYPVRSIADDVTVKVYDNLTGAVISSGEVTAKLEAATAIGSVAGSGTSPGASAFNGSVGFVPNTVRVTIANGSAVLPKDQLVYGATYTITVTSVRNAQNQYLAPGTVSNFKAGTTFGQVVVFMGAPASDPKALSANNEDGGTQGSLIVTFPYPVAVCSDSDLHTWTNTAGTAAEPAATNPVTATVGSSGGTQLTLNYNLEPLTDDTATDLSVQFSGVSVQVVGASTCTLLSSVELRDTGNSVSTQIVVRDVP